MDASDACVWWYIIKDKVVKTFSSFYIFSIKECRTYYYNILYRSFIHLRTFFIWLVPYTSFFNKKEEKIDTFKNQNTVKCYLSNWWSLPTFESWTSKGLSPVFKFCWIVTSYVLTRFVIYLMCIEKGDKKSWYQVLIKIIQKQTKRTGVRW